MGACSEDSHPQLITHNPLPITQNEPILVLVEVAVPVRLWRSLPRCPPHLVVGAVRAPGRRVEPPGPRHRQDVTVSAVVRHPVLSRLTPAARGEPLNSRRQGRGLGTRARRHHRQIVWLTHNKDCATCRLQPQASGGPRRRLAGAINRESWLPSTALGTSGIRLKQLKPDPTTVTAPTTVSQGRWGSGPGFPRRPRTELSTLRAVAA